MNHWVLGPLKPILCPKEVQIWRTFLPVSDDLKVKLQQALSEQELLRLQKFHFKADQGRFLVARGGLRDILSRYLKIPAHTINFNYTEFGKPYLNGSHLQFNVSHSANCILYAFAKKNPLGIDVEHIKGDLDFLPLAKMICSSKEYEKFLNIPENEQRLAFYRCWTRKEAVIKMIGKGLSFPLKQLEVGFFPKDAIQLLDVQSFELYTKFSWQLEEIALADHYVAAIAAAQEYHKISLWDWQVV